MIEKIILVLFILLVFLFSTLAILHADMSLAEKYFGFAMLSLFGGFAIGGFVTLKVVVIAHKSEDLERQDL